MFNLDKYEKEVLIEDDNHDTELWNALLFAIYYGKMDVIKFLMNSNLNTRLALTDPTKREGEYDDENLIEITPEDEIYGMKVCGRNLPVFLYVWDNNRYVWTEEHFLELINYLVNIKWDEGLKALLESPTSHEIFISLPLDNEIFGRLLEIATQPQDDEDDEAEDDEDEEDEEDEEEDGEKKEKKIKSKEAKKKHEEKEDDLINYLTRSPY